MLTVEWAERLPPELTDEITRTAETIRCAYRRHRILVAARRCGVVGVWVVPTDNDDDGAHARRVSRALPYTAPALLENHPQRRRDVMVQMLRALQDTFVSLELPMAPGFRDVTGCRQLGIAAEWRHTHVLDLRIPWRERYSPTVRQHLRAAESSAAFRREHVGAFRFDRALGAQSESQCHARRAFAARASAAGAVTCLAAVAGGDVVGQALTLRVTDTSILLHTWFERRGPRGVPTLLVDAAADSGYRDGARWLDLEGSVLAGVDYFMSGFGGETVSYPHLYWHRNPFRHAELILAGIAAGRETSQ